MGLTELLPVLRLVGALTGETTPDYCFAGRFRFALPGDWALAISSDAPGRIRLEAAHRSRVRCTLWCLAEDRERLADLVRGAHCEAALLAA